MTQQLNQQTREIIQKIAECNGMDPRWFLGGPDIRKTCTPLLDALAKLFAPLKERGPFKMLIHGDYDVDGITSGVMLRRVFQTYCPQAEVVLHLPLRESGYGISPDSLAKFEQEKPAVILSVDCGTNDKLLHAYAAEHPEVTVYILDHHIITNKESLPANCLLVNTHQYKGLDLCSAGMSFFTARALLGEDVFQQDYLAYAALGTVADLVMLNNPVNFTLVKMGLQYLNQRQPAWAVHLNTKPQFSAYTLGFMLGPRINAISRVGDDPMIAARALEGDLEAINALHAANLKRQQQVEAAIDSVARQALESEDDVVFVELNTCPGFVGLIASRMVDLTQKPALIATPNAEGNMTGSARSYRGIHLMDDVFNQASQYFLRYGGHEMAGGFSYSPENAEALRAALASLKLLHKRTDNDLILEIPFDGDYMNGAAIATYLTEPHNQSGNPAPIFAITKAYVKKVAPLKDGKYTKLFFTCEAGNQAHFVFWHPTDEVNEALTPVSYTDHTLTVRFKASYDPNGQFPFSFTLHEVIDEVTGEVVLSQRLLRQRNYQKA